ncbi:MAG TPA: S-adenosylmethionine:tRNA ribosyltransferase-isomerase [Acidimicrobiales bacterium]|nr:S-adenosylmethionine:tRNA ribosyltransferase-isomerase [Acidimicrobiales bacterium]
MSSLPSMPVTGADQGVSMGDYEYGLPEEAIAQRPIEPRSAARMLVDAAASGTPGVDHATVADLPRYLRPGDVLVVNQTRVLAARLTLVKQTGGAAEVLLLEPAPLEPAQPEPAQPGSVRPGAADKSAPAVWEALVRPGRRLPPGTRLWEEGGSDPVVEVAEPVAGHEDGRRWVRLIDPSVVDRAGSMPLPPYIHTPLDDPDRYQTVYWAPSDPGAQSTAAPTAGLHLTPAVLDACRQAGATVAPVDLAIGLDTFRPVTAATPEGHVIHTERYAVPAATMEACQEAPRVVAVGTTTVRALESAAATGRLSGRTDLYIHGAYPFRVVDVLLTNFHMPRSTLLLLVEAFCGPEWRDLYAIALDQGYRFLSFGDAMLVARSGQRLPPPPRPEGGAAR